MALKIKVNPQSEQFARVLYMLGFVFTRQKLFIRAEGLIANANDLLKNKFCFEKVEALYMKANLLQNIESRKAESQKAVDLAKEESSKMPAWYPYLVNLEAPEFILI
jgi:hypothetical protein